MYLVETRDDEMTSLLVRGGWKLGVRVMVERVAEIVSVPSHVRPPARR